LPRDPKDSDTARHPAVGPIVVGAGHAAPVRTASAEVQAAAAASQRSTTATGVPSGSRASAEREERPPAGMFASGDHDPAAWRAERTTSPEEKPSSTPLQAIVTEPSASATSRGDCS